MDEFKDLSRSLQAARLQSDALFEILNPGALYERAVAERHRFIFYLGHLDAFDWNLLARYALNAPSFHDEWDHLFAFGIDPESDALPSDTPQDWPAEGAVRAYCARTRQWIDQHLAEFPPQLLHVAIEHRLMHLETLGYLLYNLPFDKKRGPADPHHTSGAVPKNPLVEVSAGTAILGQESGQFGWDNEFPRNQQQTPAFRIQQHKVTNGEYLRFVKQGAPAPHFWQCDDGVYRLRCMRKSIPLPLDWPVYVTHSEATAYAGWAGMRLPREEEFHRAAYGDRNGSAQSFPWGSAGPDRSRGNFDFHRWDPMPVDAHPCGDSHWGISQLVGNGWEWTSTVFEPFEGFQPFPFYPGYSANFFDQKHYVLKGGSPRTAAPLLRPSFRNWFRPEYAYAFASFRCVSDA